MGEQGWLSWRCLWELSCSARWECLGGKGRSQWAGCRPCNQEQRWEWAQCSPRKLQEVHGVARVVGEEFINKPADGFIYKHPHHHPEPSLGLAPFCTWRCTTLGCPWTTSQGRCQCWYWGALPMPGHCCPCGTNPPLGITSSGPEVSLWSHRMSSSTWGLLENTAGLLRWLRMKHMFAYRLDACPSKSWDDQKRGMSISTANALIYCVPENMGRLS